MSFQCAHKAASWTSMLWISMNLFLIHPGISLSILIKPDPPKRHPQKTSQTILTSADCPKIHLGNSWPWEGQRRPWVQRWEMQTRPGQGPSQRCDVTWRHVPPSFGYLCSGAGNRWICGSDLKFWSGFVVHYPSNHAQIDSTQANQIHSVVMFKDTIRAGRISWAPKDFQFETLWVPKLGRLRCRSLRQS